MVWLRNHPGRAVSEADVAEIFACAYANASTYRNAVSGFTKTGINPYNPDIFTDEDFAGADVTDRPAPTTSNAEQAEHLVIVASTSGVQEPAAPVPNQAEHVVVVASAPDVQESAASVSDQAEHLIVVATKPGVQEPVARVPDPAEHLVVLVSTSGVHETAASVPDPAEHLVILASTFGINEQAAPVPDQAEHIAVVASTSTVSDHHIQPCIVNDNNGSDVGDQANVDKTQLDFSCLISIPKNERCTGATQTGRKRKSGVAVIVTSSPFKQQLQIAQAGKDVKKMAMQERKRKTDEMKAQRSKRSKTIVKKTDMRNGNKNKTDYDNSEDDNEPLINLTNPAKRSGTVTKRKAQKREKAVTKSQANDHSECIFCHNAYNDPKDPLKDDDWIKCTSCQVWQHETCAQANGVFDDDDGFLCYNCV